MDLSFLHAKCDMARIDVCIERRLMVWWLLSISFLFVLFVRSFIRSQFFFVLFHFAMYRCFWILRFSTKGRSVHAWVRGCTKSVTMRVVDCAVFVILQMLLLLRFLNSIFTLLHTFRFSVFLRLFLSWDGLTMPWKCLWLDISRLLIRLLWTRWVHACWVDIWTHSFTSPALFGNVARCISFPKSSTRKKKKSTPKTIRCRCVACILCMLLMPFSITFNVNTTPGKCRRM